MPRVFCLPLCLALFLTSCAAPKPGEEDTWGRRAENMVSPLLPSALRLGSKEPALKSAARIDPPQFSLLEQRQVRLVFSVENTTTKAERLEFPTSQRIEITVHGPDGVRLFLWSEDRSFRHGSSIVVVNPGERIEYEAMVPTRDMTSGVNYKVEVALVGRPGTRATALIEPR